QRPSKEEGASKTDELRTKMHRPSNPSSSNDPKGRGGSLKTLLSTSPFSPGSPQSSPTE
ncbi:hypothetical protein JTE90_020795, partial [Oedothorax gibbosus]